MADNAANVRQCDRGDEHEPHKWGDYHCLGVVRWSTKCSAEPLQSVQSAAYQPELVKRVSDVLMWGVTTGPNHPDASIEKFAEQVLKVIDHDGYLKPEAKA